jgi:hypothetical protein
MKSFLQYSLEKEDVATFTYTSPPGGTRFFVNNWKRLYKEAGGNGKNKVIHPDFPDYYIYPASYLGGGDSEWGGSARIRK